MTDINKELNILDVDTIISNSISEDNCELKDWTEPDDDGYIHVPDELDELFHKVGMQIRFHTISGKNEMVTIADIVHIAEKFFYKKYNS